MTELKTLKDLEACYMSNKGDASEPFALIEELRQEAIKWVKYARRIEKPATFNWMECFINFFEISEEDLK